MQRRLDEQQEERLHIANGFSDGQDGGHFHHGELGGGYEESSPSSNSSAECRRL